MRPLKRRIKARLYKRGKWWWVDLFVDGQRQRESTGAERKRDAEIYVEQRRRDLNDPTHVPAHEEAYSVSSATRALDERGLGDVADGTARMYRSKCGHLARLLGDRDCASLTAADVERYIAVRRDEGAKDHTVAKELVTARRVLAFAEKEGKLASASGWRGIFPARFRTGYDPRDRWLTEAEYLRMLEALAPRVTKRPPKKPLQDRRLWLTVACYTGGRVSELERIRWSDVDFALGFITLRTAKTRKGEPRRPRHIPMADELRAALEPVRGAGPLFPAPWANPSLRLTQVARRVGVVGSTETLCDNDLRRTFASWMLQKGATVVEVARLLGHGSTAMVERVYGHLAAQNLISAVGRLPRFTERPGGV